MYVTKAAVLRKLHLYNDKEKFDNFMEKFALIEAEAQERHAILLESLHELDNIMESHIRLFRQSVPDSAEKSDNAHHKDLSISPENEAKSWYIAQKTMSTLSKHVHSNNNVIGRYEVPITTVQTNKIATEINNTEIKISSEAKIVEKENSYVF